MKNTFDVIDQATTANDETRSALYELAAQQLAGQAFTLAVSRSAELTDLTARILIDEIAAYEGVTSRPMQDGGLVTVGERATGILLTLAKRTDNKVTT